MSNELTDQQKDIVYHFFSKLIFDLTGMEYSKNDFYRLDGRLNHLKRLLAKENLLALHQFYASNPDKDSIQLLINTATNNETFFVRDEKPFTQLTEFVIPKVLGSNPIHLNIWSAACSTGQEPLSILYKIQQDLGESVLQKVILDASDISTEALEKAKKGSYSALEVDRGASSANIKKILKENGDCYQAPPSLLAKINYFQFNLLSGNYEVNKYHIVFIRNVLIYQTVQNKQKILENVLQSLKPGGYVLFGSGESLIGLDLPLEKVPESGNLFFQKK